MNDFRERVVPDTLILEERAEMALNAMIGVADEDYESIPFFAGNFKSQPAYMTHGNWDFGSSHGRLTDSILLVREMTGSKYGEEAEMQYRKNLLSFFRADGLSYRRNTFDEETILEHQARFEESASMIDQRAVILGLTTWFLAEKDEEIKAIADRQVSALKRIARKERDSWYYPASEYTGHGWPSFDAVHTRLAVDPCAMWGRQVAPLARYYELTGNTDALELSENFTANILYRSGAFNKDGSFNGALEYRNGHFHTRMGTLASVAKLGELTRNSAYISWTKRSFDWAMTRCTSFGWTPGDMHDQAYEHETCTLVDAINTAAILARNGYPEYYGYVERFLRNHLTESQLTDVSWIHEYDKKDMDIPKSKTYYKVAQRLRGAFSGYSAPNDFVYDGKKGRGHIMDVQVCCVASGARGLYQGWQSAVTCERGRVSVNLLFNRGTQWVDVKSYLPHIGKIELDINEDIPELLVRIPEWVAYGAVGIERKFGVNTVNVTGRNVAWLYKYYINLKKANKGEKITIEFPLEERVTEEYAVDNKYSVRWRGDDVTGISPAGTYYPLYNKRKILPDVPMRKVHFSSAQARLV